MQATTPQWICDHNEIERRLQNVIAKREGNGFMYFKTGERPWSVPPQPVAESDIVGTAKADVVVIGAGFAGIMAARTLAENGKRVILLEKATKERRWNNILGGSEWAAFNSEWGIKRGVPKYDPVDYIVEYQKRSLCRCNQPLIRKIAYYQGETFDWFIKVIPEHFKECLTVFNPQYSLFTGDSSGFKSFAGTVYFDKPPRDGGNFNLSPHSLARAIEWTMDYIVDELGVDMRYEMYAEQLEKDGNRVTAAIAKDKDGKYHRFVGENGVVLAAGDFSANREMVLDLLDEFAELNHNGEKYKFVRGGGRDGSGIRMGIWAGGHIEPGPRSGMYACQVGRGGFMGGIRLNKHGKRFGNEAMAGSFIAATAGCRQPDGSIATVWDSEWVDKQARHVSYDHGSTDYFAHKDREELSHIYDKALEDMHARHAGEEVQLDDIRMNSIVVMKGNTVAAAETLEELADVLGYTGKCKTNFIKSIERYNELCYLGKDLDFGKDAQFMQPIDEPPFFGEKVAKDAGQIMVSEAGLVVDENQQVLDDSGEPIPGLYATGQCAGEVFPMQYCPPMSGCGIGTCAALGRLVGLYLSGIEV